MIMVILTIHLALAAIYTISIIALAAAAALRKTVHPVKTSAITSFVATIGSGVILVAVSPKAMAQFCTSTVIASAFGAAAWVLYKRRVVALQPKKSTLY